MIELVPISQKAAKAWVYRVHRHFKKYPAGDVYRVALAIDGEIVAVGVAGRPARMLQDGRTLAITRVASEAPVAENACSRLYGALRRAGLSLGYTRFVTYTGKDEPGTSCKAAGFTDCGMTDGGEQSRPSRPRGPVVDPEPKRRWMWPDPESQKQRNAA
jgi:hypothetical protein